MPASSQPKWSRRLGAIATKLQSASALTFTAFLTLHLAAPLSAAVGLDASETMILTREYYQTSAIEPVLVWGSIIVHIVSGSIRRAILLGPPKSLRHLSWHSITGFLLMPLVAYHAWSHRLLPRKMAISPSLLSYQYVSYSLYKHPVTSWLGYTALTAAAIYHTAAGLRSIVAARPKASRMPQHKALQSGYAALAAGVGVGLVNLARSGSDVPLWLGKRYDQILEKLYV
ncbi:hypothetical protein EMMF5_003187 [Cystobasidiomycetes sp. EMM_F5]